MRFDPAGAGTVRKNRLESDGKRSKPAGLHNPIRCVDSSPEVIRLAVMLTFRYPLSLRQVEDILFERGIDILESVRAASDRVAALTGQLEQALPNWSLAPVVRSLVALRGVDKITAMTVLAEVGDLSRFDSPRQLMGYLGLVPSEHSSGARRRRAGITRTGNGHVRRALVESAWSYRFPAQRTAHLKRKAAEASAEAQAIAWRAQRRLCGCYRTLLQAGKNTKQANVAVVRELSGFVWDIACREMARIGPARRQAAIPRQLHGRTHIDE